MSGPGFTDVACSFCDRHNREVHMVGGREGLVICSVCVEGAAQALDGDTGVQPPAGGWSGRWPHKDL